MDNINCDKVNYDSNYKLTVDEMWKTTNINIDNGIEGYDIAKVYFDHIKSKEYKKIWEKNTSDKIRSDWPPHGLKDESGNIKWPKRKNYLDDVNK